ncbi:Pkr1-domain-containing protein [Saccharata proteae CBS 121410]|uniref:Pkr1-domain-containing protein n=1 Tax=Saccharata proteae CBS 121410 TaxID=1314787 RepID=A0A9P4LW02_9PEZI|nr:Pkr1-domain-containing protein [Saccharata proteae CBS 121410]
MADFLTSLWGSIFTPGPTPTLLIATNASFAALQLVLFALLLATYSAHFVALSAISGGLWWAINWFAKELAAARAVEERARGIRERERDGKEGLGDEGGEGDDEGDDEDTETETEMGRSGIVTGGKEEEVAGHVEVTEVKMAKATGAQAALKPVGNEAGLAQRKGSGEGAESSTDSEWEKVEGDR